ncbi:MAG: trehalose-6-phosphate synthase [Desulfuromonadales bacterium GWD2_61_12]|nr:MAG: trehalose-6-phosphate synthase [Desulfuromonadales bacterium GWC2_61_20]OGR36957.1 MAG: trehalose-6-phosphate synthase [Desulfuromonadales bacterium GWD2_61_12]HAD05114.1 trehalose-6-phosphate synthase [Desulfuromonas sp.]HBT82531.1 trehalose-6-phosphate synthase [Desulfuromonas sp.]
MISIRSLRLSLRFIVPLVVALILLAYAVVPLVDKLTLRWFVRDMDIRSRLIGNTLQEPLAELLRQGNSDKINALLLRAIQDERLLALGFCGSDGTLRYHTTTFPEAIDCTSVTARKKGTIPLHQLPQGKVHVAVHTMMDEGAHSGDLVLIHDMSFVEIRSADTRKYVILLFALLGIVTSVITVFVAHLSWRGWMEGVRAMLRGEGLLKPFSQPAVASEFQPLVGDLRTLLRTLDSERRFADDATVTWSPDSLRKLLHKQLTGERVIVVSNREPYIHSHADGKIEVHRPASGLVTAVEPVMRACSGTWIAHGSGSADRETVDHHDRVQVPPENPEYTLRRIWLSPEEESGYYYGFANEGLWPLCHIAHVRPIFRSSDWLQYVAINQRFADAVIKEAASDDPVVLVQDYHFALLPAMIRQALPKATIITFWHIPWPNPESFGICPWREELLKGMLGSTILGFHTPYHCKNFLETVDRYLETRIEHESSTISRRGKLTLVESYPISIQWPPPWQETQPSVAACRAEIRAALGLSPEHKVGIGVDRQDYTKGILERFRAVEKMLELRPEMSEHFTFIQIAAPTRSALDDYQTFEDQVRNLAARINQRFARGNWQPICLKAQHHEPEIINQYFRAADVCMVTSLHDGMNLVAKEFVAARDDEQGVLVLSQFTGAAHELPEALIVNPYHIEQTAEALYQALTMADFEQRERMISMRALVRDFNVYRWAGRMLLDAARVRQREKLADRIGRES